MRSLLGIAALLALFSEPAAAAAPPLEPKDLPRIPPTEVTNVLKTFQIRKGFHLQLGAGKGEKLNVQALLNSFNWGLDNRIHGQTAGNGGLVTLSGKPNATAFDLNGRDFYFDPRTLEIEAETGGGQYGMCFDDRGRR